ncbi:MAG: pirin family protein [Acidobacteria bacterium]|nr:pirin family protein [Acidobacteriota bacterium]
MITIRKSEDRGHADYGWLDTRHTFSFADYYDPGHTRFRSLRVINEDRVSGGQGFGPHPHRDMEILSYVVSGILEHKDSMGNRAFMKAGEVQRISAGSGIEHSEYNGSPVEPVHFLQIWIMPGKKGVTPDYAERSFGAVEAGKLNLVASGSGRDGSIAIHQDAEVSVAKLAAGSGLEYPFSPGRHGWVQLIAGELAVNGLELHPGDGAAISGEEMVRLAARQDAHFLFFDLN